MVVQRSQATQQLVPYAMQNSGQTLDAHSFTTVALDDSGTLFIAVHVYKTNQPNTQLYIQYALDGGPAVPGGPGAPPATIFTTDATGTGNVAFSIPNRAVTSHTVVVEVNTMSWATYYVNVQSPPGTSIPWPPSQLGGQSLVLYPDVNRGQTIDSGHSFVTAQCDNTGTLIVFGHLYRTNQPNTQLGVGFSVDDYGPIEPSYTFLTSADGTGDFAFSVEGMTSGSHSVYIVIHNIALGPPPIYANQGIAANSPPAGIPFTCP